MGLLGSLFGGGSTTSTTNTNTSGSQQSQNQTTGTSQQQNQQNAFLNALQNLSGTGSQQTQWGLGPLGAATQAGQNYLTSQLGQGPTFGEAAANIQQYQPQFAQQAFNPTGSQQYQQGMGAAADWANTLYNRNIQPTASSMANKTGMVGSTPWAQKLTQGSSDLAANLGAQGLNYASAIQGMGTQGLMSGFNPLASLAGGNANTALGLIQTDPNAVVTGTTQQYGQTGQSQQSAEQTALANLIAQQAGQSSGSYNQTGNSTTTQQTSASPMGILGGLLNIGSSIFGGPLGGMLGGLLGGGPSSSMGDIGGMGYQNQFDLGNMMF